MAETAGFFGFDTSLPGDSSGWDEDEPSRSSNAKNDETFGSSENAASGAWPKLGEVDLVSKLDRMSVQNSSSGFPDDPAIMSLQEKPTKLPDRSAQLQNMEKIWARPQQQQSLSQSNALQNMEKIWNQAPPPGFGPPPGFAPRPEQVNVTNSMVGPNLTGPAPVGNIGGGAPNLAQMQRGLNVEELERQH